jgi:ABC-type bacteriocin/lantibiotic exporter with double-glycine peptidase domain
MMECGTTCLAIIFKYYGYYDIRAFLTEKAGVNTEGIDLYTISELAEGFGFETEGYKLEFNQLSEIQFPCIAHYEGNHFVVIYKVKNNKVWIADPAIGKYTLEKKEFCEKWNGVVLNLIPTKEIFKHNELTDLVEERRKKEKSVISRFYLSAYNSTKKYVGQIVLATIFLQLLGLALPFFTQTIIDQVLVNENLKLLYAILIGMIAIFTSQIVLTYGRNILLTQFKVSFERNFFSRFFDHFIRLKQSFFDNHKREDFINRFQENLRIRAALNPSILQGIIDFAFIALYVVVLFIYNALMGFLTLAFIAMYVAFTVYFSPRLKNLENRIFAEDLKTMGQFLDTLLGMQTVRLLGIEKLKFWKWKNQYTKALNKVLETEKTYIGLSTLLSGVFFASQAVIYWMGAYLTFKDQLTIGQYIAFITIFTIIINALSRITQLWFMLTELSVSFDRLNDVLMQEKADFDLDNKLPLNSPVKITYKNVSFKYREQEEKYALKDLSFEIEHGNFIGIVGRNGSGKTTLVKLLSKLYENYKGEITLNDGELRNILPSQIREKISVVPQEVFLFNGTIKENIQYGNPKASTEEIIEAAKAADLHAFVESLYLGYNTMVGDSGSNMSGGQRLKIALARLLVSNPEIIILDEASSSLDVETEKKVMESIKSKFRGKTIISIAHRINTLQTADKILVLDDGKLIEQGNHKELMDLNGLYKKFIDTYITY